MEPHREEEPKALEPGATLKPKRFRIVKLEERIAPRTQANPNDGGSFLGCASHVHTCWCHWTRHAGGC
jgi:hypothetical protein